MSINICLLHLKTVLHRNLKYYTLVWSKYSMEKWRVKIDGFFFISDTTSFKNIAISLRIIFNADILK